MANKGILLDENMNFIINGKTFLIGDSENQETSIIMEMNQGELKSEPMLGPNLVNMIRGKENPLKIKRQLKIHLQMDNKDYNEIKEKLKFK